MEPEPFCRYPAGTEPENPGSGRSSRVTHNDTSGLLDPYFSKNETVTEHAVFTQKKREGVFETDRNQHEKTLCGYFLGGGFGNSGLFRFGSKHFFRGTESIGTGSPLELMYFERFSTEPNRIRLT